MKREKQDHLSVTAQQFFLDTKTPQRRGLRIKMKKEKPQNMNYSPFSHHLHFVIDYPNLMNKKFQNLYNGKLGNYSYTIHCFEFNYRLIGFF